LCARLCRCDAIAVPYNDQVIVLGGGVDEEVCACVRARASGALRLHTHTHTHTHARNRMTSARSSPMAPSCPSATTAAPAGGRSPGVAGVCVCACACMCVHVCDYSLCDVCVYSPWQPWIHHRGTTHPLNASNTHTHTLTHARTHARTQPAPGARHPLGLYRQRLAVGQQPPRRPPARPPHR
jgi:hypothetical protein